MDADLPTGGLTADSCRAKRVANLNGALICLYRIGQTADAADFKAAQEHCEALRKRLDEVQATLRDESKAREGERSSEAVHGEDPQAA